MKITFKDQVAIVTGAGAGLGRSHAIALAARGAKVLVNDLGENGEPPASALAVVKEIIEAGGEAFGHGANVADHGQVTDMVNEAVKRWGRVDVLINNAGILRDKTFAKVSLEDFKLILDVHLMGAVNCTKAVWDIMKQQGYGRILMTSSSSGVYGNFGQSNYAAAKLGVVGLMNVLTLEGQKYNIKVNTLMPAAATQLTEGLITEAMKALLKPELVTPAVLFLVSKNAPNRTLMGAGAGSYAVTHICETQGVWLPPDSQSPEGIAANWQRISDPADQQALTSAGDQTLKFVNQASHGLGLNQSLSFGESSQ